MPQVIGVDGPPPHAGAAKETPSGERRYALPTLLFRGPGGCRAVPGWRPLDEYVAAAGEVCRGLGRLPTDAGVLAPDEALLRYRSMTGPEWRLLTGGGRPPGDAVPVPTAGGPLWLHPAEAREHPAVPTPSSPR